MAKRNSGDLFSEEVRARTVRLVLENEPNYKTRSECLRSIPQRSVAALKRFGTGSKSRAFKMERMKA